MRAINDVDMGGKSPKLDAGGRYSCPTCDKSYKTERGCQKHIDEANCYPDMKKLYGGTMTEAQAFAMVNDILPLFKRNTINFSQFLKGNLYQNSLSVMSFMIAMNMSHVVLDYLVWGFDEFEPKNINALFNICIYETSLTKFKEFYHTCLPSDQDIEFERMSHKDFNANDFVRMFETCRLSVKYMTENQELMGLYDELPPDYQERVLQVAGL